MKKGFSLAEVLITLAVVGVIAALTIPTIVNEHKKKVWVNSMVVAMSDFENAMTAMIMKENTDTIFDTKAWRDLNEVDLKYESESEQVNTFMYNVGKVLPLTSWGKPADYYPLKKDVRVRNLNPTIKMDAVRASLADNYLMFASKKGPAYGLYIYATPESYDSGGTTITEQDVINRGTDFFQVAGQVVIDINGKQLPNTIGRDIFHFYLGQNGKLYPMGSKDHCLRQNNNPTCGKHWSNTLTMPFGCPDDVRQAAIVVNTCAARIIEKGYKMDY